MILIGNSNVMVSFNRRQEQSTHLDHIVRYIYTYVLLSQSTSVEFFTINYQGPKIKKKSHTLIIIPIW